MELPKFYETFIPILQVLKGGEILHYRELVLQVRQRYYSGLPQELLDQKNSTGSNVLLDRIAWGKSYLKLAKFISSSERGMVQITDKGRKVLKNEKLSLKDLKNDPDFLNRQINQKKKNDNTLENSSPQEWIDRGFEEIKTKIKDELLEKLKAMDPYSFQKVILKLLNKMGYGDFVETPKSRDGGIDGILNQDKLGLEKIYIQVKRYDENKIREKDIRNFIGAMSSETLKGVFVTTSSFDISAIQKANQASHKIILVDGEKLTDLMIEYNVGVQVNSVYEVKKIDEDFFEFE